MRFRAAFKSKSFRRANPHAQASPGGAQPNGGRYYSQGGQARQASPQGNSRPSGDRPYYQGGQPRQPHSGDNRWHGRPGGGSGEWRPRRQQQNRPHGPQGRHGANGHRHWHPRPQAPDRRHDEGPSEAERRFFAKAAVDPAPRIYLEKGLAEWTMRAMDLVSPIGRGQRGLIVSPPKSGKTTFLKHICQAITQSQPDMKVYVLLIDERPEEVTDFKRSVTAEVHWSSSDQPYENHIRVAQDLMKKAVEEADSGQHVMIMVDSLTRLARVHNTALQHTGRTLSGGMDARGLLIPRKIFGSARNIENGGSLGIIATILVQTGSRMDDVIFQEFKGTGNMELVLSREISERRIFPAINIRQSGTRKEELLMSKEELNATRVLRAALAEMGDIEAMQQMVNLLQKFPTNTQIFSSLTSR